MYSGSIVGGSESLIFYFFFGGGMYTYFLFGKLNLVFYASVNQGYQKEIFDISLGKHKFSPFTI